MNKLKIFILCIILHQNIHAAFLSGLKGAAVTFAAGSALGCSFGYFLNKKSQLQRELKDLLAQHKPTDILPQEVSIKMHELEGEIGLCYSYQLGCVLTFICTCAYLACRKK